jgi:hypothetical protein
MSDIQVIVNSSILVPSTWLHQFDLEPLVSNNTEFSAVFAKALLDYRLAFTLMPTSLNKSIVQLVFDPNTDKDLYRLLISQCDTKYMQALHCPYLVQEAQRRITSNSEKKENCDLEQPLRDVTKRMAETLGVCEGSYSN